MGKNAMMPLAILRRITYMLYHWNVADYDDHVRNEYYDVRKFLNLKLGRVEARMGNDEASSEYFRLKERLCDDTDYDVPF